MNSSADGLRRPRGIALGFRRRLAVRHEQIAFDATAGDGEREAKRKQQAEDHANSPARDVRLSHLFVNFHQTRYRTPIMKHRFRYREFLTAAVAASLLALSACDQTHQNSAAGSGALAKLKPDEQPKPVPAVAFSDAAGARHSLSEFRGRYLLLNLWATWCAPCVKELPALSHLQAAIGPRKLIVVPVNVGRDNATETTKFLKQHRAALPVYIDTNSAFLHAFGAYGLPLTVLIDPRGREIARAIGAVRWDEPEALAYFRGLGAHS